jgi:Lrp/AsnC family transcriptional regulator for asnA, asnC and gidA
MIDNLDKELVFQLQEDAKRSYADLGKLLHVAETTVRNRVKQLIKKKIIKIAAISDPKVLGYQFMGIMGLQVRLEDLRVVAEHLAKHPNVCYVISTTGRYDLIAIVFCKSSSEFAGFMENEVATIPSVLRTETFVSLNIFKGQESGLDTRQLISNFNTL